MNTFTFSYPTRVYFGEGVAPKALAQELPNEAKTVMLAYGGGSIKASGIYDQIKGLLEQAGKKVVDFSGIMPNPTYDKVQQGAKLAREQQVDYILAVGGGSVIDCCKIVAAQAKTEQDLWEMEFVNHQVPNRSPSDRRSSHRFRHRRGDERRRGHHQRGKKDEDRPAGLCTSLCGFGPGLHRFGSPHAGAVRRV